jgi:hypothetical protein
LAMVRSSSQVFQGRDPKFPFFPGINAPPHFRLLYKIGFPQTKVVKKL